MCDVTINNAWAGTCYREEDESSLYTCECPEVLTEECPAQSTIFTTWPSITATSSTSTLDCGGTWWAISFDYIYDDTTYTGDVIHYVADDTDTIVESGTSLSFSWLVAWVYTTYIDYDNQGQACEYLDLGTVTITNTCQTVCPDQSTIFTTWPTITATSSTSSLDCWGAWWAISFDYTYDDITYTGDVIHYVVDDTDTVVDSGANLGFIGLESWVYTTYINYDNHGDSCEYLDLGTATINDACQTECPSDLVIFTWSVDTEPTCSIATWSITLSYEYNTTYSATQTPPLTGRFQLLSIWNTYDTVNALSTTNTFTDIGTWSYQWNLFIEYLGNSCTYTLPEEVVIADATWCSANDCPDTSVIQFGHTVSWCWNEHQIDYTFNQPTDVSNQLITLYSGSEIITTNSFGVTETTSTMSSIPIGTYSATLSFLQDGEIAGNECNYSVTEVFATDTCTVCPTLEDSITITTWSVACNESLSNYSITVDTEQTGTIQITNSSDSTVAVWSLPLLIWNLWIGDYTVFVNFDGECSDLYTTLTIEDGCSVSSSCSYDNENFQIIPSDATCDEDWSITVLAAFSSSSITFGNSSITNLSTSDITTLAYSLTDWNRGFNTVSTGVYYIEVNYSEEWVLWICTVPLTYTTISPYVTIDEPSNCTATCGNTEVSLSAALSFATCNISDGEIIRSLEWFNNSDVDISIFTINGSDVSSQVSQTAYTYTQSGIPAGSYDAVLTYAVDSAICTTTITNSIDLLEDWCDQCTVPGTASFDTTRGDNFTLYSESGNEILWWLDSTTQPSRYSIVHLWWSYCAVTPSHLDELYPTLIGSELCSYQLLLNWALNSTLPDLRDNYDGNNTLSSIPWAVDYFMSRSYEYDIDSQYCDGSRLSEYSWFNGPYNLCSGSFPSTPYADHHLAFWEFFNISPVYFDTIAYSHFFLFDNETGEIMYDVNWLESDEISPLVDFCSQSCNTDPADTTSIPNWDTTCAQSMACYTDSDFDGAPSGEIIPVSGSCYCPFETIPEAEYTVAISEGLIDCNDNSIDYILNCIEVCDNGIDDDLDGLVDATDTDDCAYLGESWGEVTSFSCDYDRDYAYVDQDVSCGEGNIAICNETCPEINGFGNTDDGCCIWDFNITSSSSITDNCPSDFNTDQSDLDGDGIWDSCDNDADNDGIPSSQDDCDVPWMDCDNDYDNDTIPDIEDACPYDETTDCSQTSSTDSDSDGIGNTIDNCPNTPNTDQADFDADTVWDMCDSDDDDDGITDVLDLCNDLTLIHSLLDTDQDGIWDDCDEDRDGDQVNNTFDNCILIANSNQADADTDGIGDSCDSDYEVDKCEYEVALIDPDIGETTSYICDEDVDDDQVADSIDNAVLCYNRVSAGFVQLDLDEDGLWQAEPDSTGNNTINWWSGCDPDTDWDEIVDTEDTCDFVNSNNNSDTDGDGSGDVCDDDDDGDGLLDSADICPLDGTDQCQTTTDVSPDGDNIPDTIEDAWPNNGDANGDGLLDSAQPWVASLETADGYVALDVTLNSACVPTTFDVLDESNLAVQENEYDYTYGLNSFQIDCGTPWASTVISIWYDKILDTTDVTFRKYNPYTREYTDITDLVQFQTRQVGSNSVTVVTYTVQDWWALDTDGYLNGIITDPAGPAFSSSDTATDTSTWSTSTTWNTTTTTGSTTTTTTTSWGWRASSITPDNIVCGSNYIRINNSCVRERSSSNASNSSISNSLSASVFGSSSTSSSLDNTSPALNKVVQRIKDSIKSINTACEGDPLQGYQRTQRMRDVSREDRSDASFKLSLYCVTSGYGLWFQNNALTSIGEAIKIISTVHALANDNTISKRVTTTGYRDAPAGAWYAPYVSYARQYGLLEGVTEEHPNQNDLKALTPISESQFKLLLRNAWGDAAVAWDFLDQFTALLHGSAGWVTRGDLSEQVVEAFPGIFADAEIMVGNNIQMYRTILSQLQNKSTSRQERYLEWVIEKLETSSRDYFASLGIDIEVIIEVLKSGLE